MRHKKEFVNMKDRLSKEGIPEPFSAFFLHYKNLRKTLLSQFLQTELKPNLRLYLEDAISAQEFDEGYREIHRLIPETKSQGPVAANFVAQTDFEKRINDLTNSFYDKVIKNELPECFKSHFISDTHLAKELTALQLEIQDFGKTVFDPLVDLVRIAEVFCKNLILRLEYLRIPLLKELVLNQFTLNQTNPQLEIRVMLDTDLSDAEKTVIEERYRSLKRNADVIIGSYLKEKQKRKSDALKTFNQIGFLDFKAVNQALAKLSGTNERLGHLLELRRKYYDPFTAAIDVIRQEDPIFQHEYGSLFWDAVFGNFRLVNDSLHIQEPVYDKYFSESHRDPEFTWWLLQFAARELFEDTLKGDPFQSKMNSNLKITFLQSELDDILQKERVALDLLHRKELDIYNRHPNNYMYRNEVILLRIMDGNYYRTFATDSIPGKGSFEVQAYCRHFLLKTFLQKQLVQPVPGTKQTYTNMESLLTSKAEEMYHSPLSYDVYVQDQKEYFKEFNARQTELSDLILKYELDYYSFLKDVADYKFNGRDYKNPLPEEYYVEKEIEAQLLAGYNVKHLFDRCFEIVSFLTAKSAARLNTANVTGVDLESAEAKIRFQLLGLRDDFLGHDSETSSYQYNIEFIKEHRFLVVNKTLKVFSAGIAYIFTNNKIPVVGPSKQNIDLETFPFFETFKKSFEEGVSYFKEHFELSKELLYGPQMNVLIADLHHNYYHADFGTFFIGWNSVRGSDPLIISHELVHKYGFYSGCLDAADLYMARYPNAFKTFHILTDEMDNEKVDSSLKQANSQITYDEPKILEILKPLSGFKNGQRILSSIDFERLLRYAMYIVRNGSLPSDALPFPRTRVSTLLLRQTLYRAYLVNKKFRSAFVDLVHLFDQLQDVEKKTTLKNFSTYANTYDQDINTITY